MRFRALIDRVETPGQYLGGEVGAVVKNPDSVDQRWALLFPDTYAIGMSHVGLKILYGLLNRIPWIAAERGFAPWGDMEAEMRGAGVPLLTLETHRPVRDFDVVGFSLQYELSYTNVLAMLDLAGIPVRAAERGEDDPVVVAGGSNAFHAEPLADYIDLFLLGDGEEAAPALAEKLRACRRAGLGRRETLLALAREVPGLYAPAFYDPDSRKPLEEGLPERILPALVANFEDAYFPTDPPVPFVRVTQDRIAIEVMRGCTQGCRFCQAGMLKRPNRMRSVEKVLELARESYERTGYDEIALLSLSTSDYPHLLEVAAALDREFRDRRVGISIPSLRVNETLRRIPEILDRVRKSGLTVAPEVATDRLRAVILKDIRNEDLYAGVREAYRAGWRAVKLYFMIGLPTETDEDVDAIVEMGRRVSELGREAGGAPGKVTLSVSNFVPKPHTPFQWAPMATEEELVRKRERLLAAVRPHRSIRLKVHDYGRSLMEGVLARGDRSVGRALLRLAREGSRFDAWDDHFDYSRWKAALAAEGIDADGINHRPRDADEVLPWDHLGAPVSREYLDKERERSERGEMTANCMDGKCNHCGLDVKTCAPSLEVYREARRSR